MERGVTAGRRGCSKCTMGVLAVLHVLSCSSWVLLELSWVFWVLPWVVHITVGVPSVPWVFWMCCMF